MVVGLNVESADCNARSRQGQRFLVADCLLTRRLGIKQAFRTKLETQRANRNVSLSNVQKQNHLHLVLFAKETIGGVIVLATIIITKTIDSGVGRL